MIDFICFAHVLLSFYIERDKYAYAKVALDT